MQILSGLKYAPMQILRGFYIKTIIIIKITGENMMKILPMTKEHYDEILGMMRVF